MPTGARAVRREHVQSYFAEDSLTPRGIAQWFTARNRLLSGRRPVDALHEGDTEAVRQAAVSFAEGGYVRPHGPARAAPGIPASSVSGTGALRATA